MKEIWTRLTSESPTFFKRIQVIAILIGSVGGGILAAPATLGLMGIPFILPATLSTVATHMAVVGAVAAFVAKTPVVDPNVLNKPTDNTPKQ